MTDSKMSTGFLRELQGCLFSEVHSKVVFAAVYGSYAVGTASERSDVDILVLCRDLTPNQVGVLAATVKSLHEKYRLATDEEVPYRVKLVASYADVVDALCMQGFEVNLQSKSITIPPVEKTNAFLTSRAVKLRLILNCLTSPTLFIAGDSFVLDATKKEAARKLVLLAAAVQRSQEVSVSTVVATLLNGEGNAQGELYLGYSRAETTLHYLEQCLGAAMLELADRSILAAEANDKFVILNWSTAFEYLVRGESSVIFALSR